MTNDCTTPYNMAFASCLPNGAQILARFQCVDRQWIVLCSKRPTRENPREYVTWDCDSAGNAYCGHYFSIGEEGDPYATAYESAARDYQERIARALGVKA